VSTQQLEDICWYPSEDEDKKLFATAHNDGSYIVWDIEVGQKPKKDATTPYGPFPCKRIGKLKFWKDNDEEVMCAFSGGMPRRDYGDHFTVTVKAEGSLLSVCLLIAFLFTLQRKALCFYYFFRIFRLTACDI